MAAIFSLVLVAALRVSFTRFSTNVGLYNEGLFVLR